MTLSPVQIESITEMLLKGNKSGASKLFQVWSGCSRAEATTHIEQLELELRRDYPDKFGLPATPPDPGRYEQIYGDAGLAQAIGSLAEPWTIRSFEDIPMGWKAELQLEELRVVLSAERNSISAMSFVAGQRFDPPDVPNQDDRSNFEVVRLLLESARSYWKERDRA